jgi:hypothetical protein
MIVTREIVVEKFFDRVVVHFPLGRARPRDKFLPDLVAALIADRVTEPVIEEAALTAIANHDGRFPSVARCRQFCREARATLRSAGETGATSVSHQRDIAASSRSNRSETDSNEETGQ